MAALLPAPPIPNLPGYDLLGSRGTGAPGRENKVPQTLTYKDGKAIVLDRPGEYEPVDRDRHNWVGSYEEQERRNAELHRQQREKAVLTESKSAQNRHGAPAAMQWTGRKAPGWLTHDGKVLRFSAYFIEPVENSPLEKTRVRRFQISYFLEDSSIEILEPQEPNSGLPQGKFLQRHKVKLQDGTTLSWEQLQVGRDLTLYGRTFRIAGCETATREHFVRHGIMLPQDMPLPDGAYDTQLKDKAQGGKPTETVSAWSKDETDPLLRLQDAKGPGVVFNVQYDKAKTTQLERRVLRFFCCWDDSGNTSGAGKGQRLSFALHCYPADDTIEIVEMHRRNDGRDPFPILLKKCKLPKSPNIPPIGGRPMSPVTYSRLNITYYGWRDLFIGLIVKVYGRDMLIYDCDASTKQWYKEFAGLTDAAFVPLEVDFDMLVKRPQLPIPPNECGIGSEEDSMRNVLSLVPKRKPGNYNHYLVNADKVLRFKSRMVLLPGQRELISPHDVSRRFVISFYPVDNTIAVFEPKQPNSGLPGGTFLERCKVWKAGASSSGVREELSYGDMQVGAVLNIFSRGFELLEADEHTLRHMEEYPGQYPHANWELVLLKVQQRLTPQAVERIKEDFLHEDAQGTGLATPPQLKASFDAAGVDLTLHEALTLVRAFGKDSQANIEQLVAVLEGGRPQEEQQAPQQQAADHLPVRDPNAALVGVYLQQPAGAGHAPAPARNAEAAMVPHQQQQGQVQQQAGAGDFNGPVPPYRQQRQQQQHFAAAPDNSMSGGATPYEQQRQQQHQHQASVGAAAGDFKGPVPPYGQQRQQQQHFAAASANSLSGGPAPYGQQRQQQQQGGAKISARDVIAQVLPYGQQRLQQGAAASPAIGLHAPAYGQTQQQQRAALYNPGNGVLPAPSDGQQRQQQQLAGIAGAGRGIEAAARAYEPQQGQQADGLAYGRELNAALHPQGHHVQQQQQLPSQANGAPPARAGSGYQHHESRQDVQSFQDDQAQYKERAGWEWPLDKQQQGGRTQDLSSRQYKPNAPRVNEHEGWGNGGVYEPAGMDPGRADMQHQGPSRYAWGDAPQQRQLSTRYSADSRSTSDAGDQHQGLVPQREMRRSAPDVPKAPAGQPPAAPSRTAFTGSPKDYGWNPQLAGQQDGRQQDGRHEGMVSEVSRGEAWAEARQHAGRVPVEASQQNRGEAALQGSGHVPGQQLGGDAAWKPQLESYGGWEEQQQALDAAEAAMPHKVLEQRGLNTRQQAAGGGPPQDFQPQNVQSRQQVPRSARVSFEVDRPAELVPKALPAGSVSRKAADHNKSDRHLAHSAVGVKQPPSLWQTTNQALGGFYHANSFRHTGGGAN